MPDAKKTDNVSTEMMDASSDALSVFGNLFSATQAYWAGISRYTTDFYNPFILASQYFNRVEGMRLLEDPPVDSFEAYIQLLQNNLALINRSVKGTTNNMTAYAQLEMDGLTDALQQSCFKGKLEKLARYTKRQAELMEMVAYNFPQSIDAIEPEFGFHFERGKHALLDETDRFLLYRVSPSLKQVKTRPDAKPVLIIPPFVLGANILGFLPDEQRSYAHSFANQGIPTYIRVLKDIDSSPALQIMAPEDDTKDTRRFCEAILKAHGKPVTLNGYCQGGYTALCNLLSGQLDGLVDAFITCVSPMDGTRSKGLAHLLSQLPAQFNNLSYGTKILPNGNKVADGLLMGWVYKLRSIKHEIPSSAFFRDVSMFARQKDSNYKISKTAAALNYWLKNERNDLPLEVTRMSFTSYNVPITKDGTLPVRLFGQKLNIKRLQDKKIPWLICYGTDDDLVEKETALAPLDFIDAEVTPFPKGHVAIATSWSSPDSACALHTRFGEGNYRGPVLFHMDLDAALSKTAPQKQDKPSVITTGTALQKQDKVSAVMTKAAPQTKAKASAVKTKATPQAKAKASAVKTKAAPQAKAKVSAVKTKAAPQAKAKVSAVKAKSVPQTKAKASAVKTTTALQKTVEPNATTTETVPKKMETPKAPSPKPDLNSSENKS